MLELWNKYGFLGVMVSWAALSLVVNTLLKMRSADDWVKALQANPLGGALVKFMETMGVDPVSFINHFREVVDEKAEGPKP